MHNYIHEGIEVVKMANDKSTQTLCSKVELASKIETMVLKNELKNCLRRIPTLELSATFHVKLLEKIHN